MAHWWKPAAFAALRPGCQRQLSRKTHKRLTVRLLTQQTRSAAHLCVKRRAVFSGLCWRCEWTVTVAKQTKKRSVTTDDETETETEVSSKNIPAIIDYRHPCHERQRNENLWDYNFNSTKEVSLLFMKSLTLSYPASSGQCGCGLITFDWQWTGNISKQTHIIIINRNWCTDICDITVFQPKPRPLQTSKSLK